MFIYSKSEETYKGEKKYNAQIQSNIAIHIEEQLSAAGIFQYTSGNPTLQH
jgi:hypothetical protein